MTIKLSSPFLPSIEEFSKKLEMIWESGQLTNSGAMHNELENSLQNYLNVEHVSLFCNGTSALIAALNCSNIKGEVITTPFTYIATSNAILSANLTPVFADINPQSYNLDPHSVETLISSKTAAILPVHTFGHSCDTDAFQKLSEKYKIKLLYDAAHSFGANCHCGKLFQCGHASVLSFHATKVFHTFEGGAVCTNDKDLKQKLDKYKNFGLTNQKDETTSLGLNLKLTEIQAAMGLIQLEYINKIIKKRRSIFSLYMQELASIKGITPPRHININESNGSYFPILVNEHSKITRDHLFEELSKNGITCRKYFYPSLEKFEHLKNFGRTNKNLINSRLVSDKILCLPMHTDLTQNHVFKITKAIRSHT